MEAEIIACYEALAAVSARMLDAAHCGDADALEQAQAQCLPLIARLREVGDKVPLSVAGQRRKMDLLRTLLADDARIRRLTEPWMLRLDALLGGAAAGRKMQQAYGAP